MLWTLFILNKPFPLCCVYPTLKEIDVSNIGVVLLADVFVFMLYRVGWHGTDCKRAEAAAAKIWQEDYDEVIRD